MEKRIDWIDESSWILILQNNIISNTPEWKELCQQAEKWWKESTNQKIKSKLWACLRIANQNIEQLKTLLAQTTSSLSCIQPTVYKPVKIYIDGVFDITHSGHFNALRQAKKWGDILVWGINSDEEVEKVKGPTIMTCKERAAWGRACKWVDEVVEDTPYTPSLELMEQIGVDFCSHGDDIAFNEKGESVYDEIIKAGKMKIFKRTEGVSTTEIIGRWWSCSKDRKAKSEQEMLTTKELISEWEQFEKSKKPVMSSFLATSWRISEFCNNRVPQEGDKIVYIDGAFDILHVGHVETLRKAREMGDFLYVGVHDDDIVNKYKGQNYPIWNLNERVFNWLAIKYVDEVVIATPWKIT
ncbi:MAG: adenylyltransferase/cytidyltransferase family protein, partial [Mycoplasma sp.]